MIGTKDQDKFNIRVYALIINENREVLLTDEFRIGQKFTKFPGGGLKHGEGTIECIKRECMEELHQEVEVLDHYYTTDFFLSSAFNQNEQLISIYYLIKPIGPIAFDTTQKQFDFEELIDGAQTFRWLPIEHLKPGQFRFAVDQKVAAMLKENAPGPTFFSA